MSTEYKPFLGVGLIFEWKEFKAFLEYYSLTEVNIYLAHVGIRDLTLSAVIAETEKEN